MRVIRDINAESGAVPRGFVAVIGNFDGVHLGHQHVILEAQKLASELETSLMVMSFEPHPRRFFNPDFPPLRLISKPQRVTELERLGVHSIVELNFDSQLAEMSSADFVHGILSNKLGLRGVVIGENFRFGKGREGDVAALKELAAELGIKVIAVPLLEMDDIEAISSTSIRQALSTGDLMQVRRMLGRGYLIEGEVIHGEKRGRELGYPTANIALSDLHLPRFGVYAVRAHLEGQNDGAIYEGVAALGVRPMFGENAPNLEVHLFDFSADLYGKTLGVELVAYLRDEAVFPDQEALIQQMDRDSASAKRILRSEA